MKILKSILVVTILLLMASCSKDDDNVTLPQLFLPATITITEPLNTSENRTISFQYDNMRRITQTTYNYENTPSDNFVSNFNYNSNGSIGSIVSGEENVSFQYNAQNQLTNIIIDDTESILEISVSYNSATNTYTLSANDETVNVSLNSNNNVITGATSSYILTVNMSNGSGVFVNAQIPEILKVVSTVFLDFDSLFFASQQIDSVVSDITGEGTNSIQFQNTRNSNGLISTIQATVMGATVLSYEISYNEI